ncbi:hypothetical protein [Gluconobacter morbifer]|nr:hypothetical protein [Gluconobacter morbifer]
MDTDGIKIKTSLLEVRYRIGFPIGGEIEYRGISAFLIGDNAEMKTDLIRKSYDGWKSENPENTPDLEDIIDQVTFEIYDPKTPKAAFQPILNTDLPNR